MALDITPVAHAQPIDFAEFTARLDAMTVDFSHDEGRATAAELLSALYTNRSFLVERAIAELKAHCAQQNATNQYGAQVLLLHRKLGAHFVRCNFWPALDDPILLASGASHYFYHIPHDHNFDFLTVGYQGPGYGSRWYEYDNGAVAGYAGEPVDLRCVEQGNLFQGRMLHYRAHRDVHDQLPPTSLSISLNIVPETGPVVWRDQYLFDLDRPSVAALTTISQGEIALRIAAAMSDDGMDIAQHFARTHPSERVRWRAWRAIIGTQHDSLDRRATLDRALMDQSTLVVAEARQMMAHLDDDRGDNGTDAYSHLAS